MALEHGRRRAVPRENGYSPLPRRRKMHIIHSGGLAMAIKKVTVIIEDENFNQMIVDVQDAAFEFGPTSGRDKAPFKLFGKVLSTVPQEYDEVG